MTRIALPLTLLCFLVLAGCAGPLSALDPAGPSAHAVATMWWVMFWGSVALFALVMILLALVWLRPGFGARVAPMRWIVLGGLAMPLVILAALVAYALYTGEQLLPKGERPTRVSAQGVMWDWVFSYPDMPDAGMSEVLHIPAGEPVDVVVTSADVIHAFWVPRLSGKIDAIPGHENVVRIQADRPGTYHGVCAEFCGLRHTDMRFEIEAHAPQDYAQAVMEASQ